MVLAICGLQVNKLKNKNHIFILKVLIYSIIIINLLCIFFLKNRSNMVILIFSQLSFILFICITYFIIKKIFSNFYKNLLITMDKMINHESIDTPVIIDNTYISQTFHRLTRLYDILQAKQHSIEKEKNKLQSFVSDISHQLKTPITNLKLLQEALKQADLPPETYQNYLDAQKKQLEKIDFLIQSLLKTAQLENGLIHLQPGITSIESTILSSLEGILIPAEKKNIEIHYDNTKDYTILHDSKWTSEALFNIMENAIKYTPPYGKLIISLNQTEKYIKISIKDTGIGIPPTELPNIFTRFWRGNTKILEGNGIGLYLCKQIITLQHGYILANSTVNLGTEFQVFLPKITQNN